MYYILYCAGPLHISPSGTYHPHHQAQVGTGHSTTPQDIHVSTTHHNTVGDLPQNNYFPFKGKYYEQVPGIPHQSHCGQPVYGRV